MQVFLKSFKAIKSAARKCSQQRCRIDIFGFGQVMIYAVLPVLILPFDIIEKIFLRNGRDGTYGARRIRGSGGGAGAYNMVAE